MSTNQLSPGQIIFIEANGETAAPGWYIVRKFDHKQTREYPEGGWWWVCERLVDSIMQTIEETDPHLHVDIEGLPSKAVIMKARINE